MIRDLAAWMAGNPEGTVVILGFILATVILVWGLVTELKR